MKGWHFDVLFTVGVGGAVFLLISPLLGADEILNPTAMTGVGAILTFVLTQKRSIVKHEEDGKHKKSEESAETVEESEGKTND